MDGATVADGGANPVDRQVMRLSDFERTTNLYSYSKYLGFIDVLIIQFRFHVYASRKFWGKYEAVSLALVSASVIMGAWDYGIGELSGGGDWSRGGILGEESGFLHLKEWSIMLSLLSIMSWFVAIILMWTRYPIMRENLVFLVVALFSVQLGHIHSHSKAPYFPYDSGISDWSGVAMGNMIMIFLSVFVVHRAVTETRDIHVEEKHAHPDPRLVEKAWSDHRLDAWSWSLALWALMINIMSWSGAHAISQRPPIEDGIFGLSVLYVFSGIFSFFLLMHVVWYPHFMLGGRPYNPILTSEGGCRNCDEHQRRNPARTLSGLWCGDPGSEEALRFHRSPLLRSGVSGLGDTGRFLLFMRQDTANETRMRKMRYQRLRN